MADDQMNGAQKIADSVWLVVVARVSMAFMPPLVGLIVYLGGGYLEGKFDAVNVRVTSVEHKADETSSQGSKINDRLIAVETSQTAAASSREKFETATLQRLDRVQDSLVGLSNAVAALTATMQAMAEQRAPKPP